MSGDPEPGTGGDIIADLVHQFSDPFAFYRELIQNSIDAGSNRIEVTLAHQPGVPRGLTTARVADWGEGMDRNVIDRYLLTKFRSSKEGDLTKIGKFGIGFLSVFAPAPDLVVVDTGRNGEDWRLLFHPDLTWELLRAPQPCEGTAVTLHEAMTAQEYREFAARSEESVRRWCRHSDADVAFAAGDADGGAPRHPVGVREPFAADALFQVEYRDPHTRIAAGPALGDPPMVGFYNRGLTLLEQPEALVPGVAFKVISDHLEHTLTRDNVRRDARFEKILDRVRDLARREIPDRLAQELKSSALRESPGRDYERLLGHAERLLQEGRLPLARIFVPTIGGAADAATLRRAVERHGALVWSVAAGPVSDALERAGTPVLRQGERSAAVMEVARRLAAADEVCHAEAEFAVALPLDARTDGERRDAEALAAAIAPLLRAAGAFTRRVLVAHLHGAGSSLAFAPFTEVGVPQASADCASSPFRERGAELLCLNRDHTKVASALGVARRAPGLAALLLARLIAVSAGALTEEADRRLTSAALGGAGA